MLRRWLPPNKRFRCAYVARQVAVKRKYRAWVTRAEHDAIARVLATCPGQKLPARRRGARAGRADAQGADATSAAHAGPDSGAAPARGRVFANCDAVRAAGLAPLRRGSADYAANPKLDRDKDGVACE